MHGVFWVIVARGTVVWNKAIGMTLGIKRTETHPHASMIDGVYVVTTIVQSS